HRKLTAWPAAATSDAEGRFALRGLARELNQIVVRAADPRFQSEATMLRTDDGSGRIRAAFPIIQVDPGPDPKPITMALQPARTTTGRVTYADTGQPVPHAIVGTYSIRYPADDQGRFRVPAPRTPAGRHELRAFAPDDDRYLIASKLVEWPAGAVERSVDL